VARCLIIGCGCRGQALARTLVAQGHLVRGTTRDPGRCPEIAKAGAEPVVADPDRVGTLLPAVAGVSVVAILLGSAAGPDRELEALHGPRLEALLGKLVDTTVRGVVYEARGGVGDGLLRAGAERVRSFAARSRAACEVVLADPGCHGAWLAAAEDALRRVLAAR